MAELFILAALLAVTVAIAWWHGRDPHRDERRRAKRELRDDREQHIGDCWQTWKWPH